MTTKLKIPKIRFKEFSSEWEEKKLGEMFPKIRNGFVGIATPYYVNDGIKYLQGKNIKNNKIKDEGLIYINSEFHNKKISSQLKTNDIVMVQSGHIGECAVITEEYNNSNCHALIIMTPNKNINSYFFNYYFYSELGKKSINIITTGNTIKHILTSDLKPLKIYTPEFPEQQKIASFLSSVDEKIEKIKEKKKNLEEYKKGVMQKIFSQELRFKDENGEEFGEWEEKKLGELCDIIVGGTPSTNNPLFWDGEINWLSSGELNNGYITETNKKITELGLKKSATKLMPINTVLLAMTGATLGRIGFLKIESSGNQSIAGFIPNGNYNSKFLFYTLENGFNYVLSFAAGAAQPGVNKTTIENFIFPFPILKEQEKIADFLSGIDEKIEKVNDELEKMEDFKKGLLQGMFV